MADATRYLMAASPEEEIAVVEEATNREYARVRGMERCD